MAEEKKKNWKKILFKELFFELIPSLFQLKIIFPALLLAGAAGYVGYDFGFGAGADSIVCPELDCVECLEGFGCEDVEGFESCFPCPEVRDIVDYNCTEIFEARPDCKIPMDCPELPEINCDFCNSLNCTAA